MDFDLPLDRKPEQMSGDTEAFTGLATDQRGETEYDGPAGGYAPVGRLRRQYLDFLAVKEPEIEEQRDARRYYHGSHWSADEIRILRKRRQPVITFNRIARKINGICGMVERLRQDPKAFPRNPKGEDGAEIATQCVRYVLDGTADGEDGGLGWQFMSSESARHAGIDGISGVELKLINGDHDDPDLTLSGEDAPATPPAEQPPPLGAKRERASPPEEWKKTGQAAYDEGFAHAKRGIGRRQGVYDQANYDKGFFEGRDGKK